MKNNFITKIIGATLAFAMMIGVGAGLNSNKQANPIFADNATMSVGGNSSSATVNSKAAIKCGASGKKGAATITLANAGATSLDVYVGGWNNDTGRTIDVTVPSGVTISPASFTVENESAFTGTASSFTVSDESIHLKHFTLSNAVANTTVTFTAHVASKNRFVVWGPTYSTAVQEYAVTYQANGGTGDDYVVNNIASGSTHELVSFATTGFTAPAGKQFKCWSIDSVERNPGYELTVSSDVSVLAIWENIPSQPFIEPSKNATTGYTEQNEVLSFNYGNLTGNLSVESSNTSVVTVQDLVYENNEGLVQINFVGAGSTNVLFKDGQTQRASVAVTVTESTVTITGLPSTRAIYVGETDNFSSLITVTAVGACSNAVSWSSSEPTVATVTSAGVVSAVANGSTDITVTSNDYPSATMTCTVTVSTVSIDSIDLTTSSYSEDSDELIVWELPYKLTMQIAKSTSSTAVTNYYPGGGKTSTRFYKDQLLTLTPSPVGITAVKAVFAITSDDYATAFVGSNFTNSSATKNGMNVTVTFTDGTEPATIKIGGTCGITTVTFYYEQAEIVNPEPYMTFGEPIKTISGHEAETQQAANANVVFSEVFNADTVLTSTSSGQLTISGDKGSNNNPPKYYNNGTALRTYSGNTITFSAQGNVTQITFTLSEGTISSLSPSTGSFDGNVWTGSAQSVVFTISATTRISSVNVNYQSVNVSIDTVCLKFGVSVPVSVWTTINETWPITCFGVMFLKYTTLHNTYGANSIAAAYENGVRPRANVYVDSGETPYQDGDNYVFTARINMTDEDNYGIVYVAAPYIVAGGQYYFFTESEGSVNSIATACRANGGSDLSNAALDLLVGNQGD